MSARPLRVGIDLCSLAYGNRTRGTGVYAENLVWALSRLETTNTYIVFVSARDPSECRLNIPENFALIQIPTYRIGKAAPLVSHQWTLPRMCWQLDLDVLHCIGVSHNASIPGVPYWQTVPTVVTVHDLSPLVMGTAILPAWRHRAFYRLQLNACRRAAHLIADSSNTARDLTRFGIAPPERIRIIPLAAPPHVDEAVELTPALRALISAPYLLHVGGAEPQKNQEAVLSAFGELCRDENFDHRLVLVGGRHLGDEGATRISPRAAGRIVRLSGLGRAELQILYEHCAVFIFPSLYEGFGLPILEAMSNGAPVVAASTSSLPEVAGDAALFVAPGDSTAIAQAVRRLLQDETLREKFRAAGFARAREFSWARTAQETDDVYRTVAELRQ